MILKPLISPNLLFLTGTAQWPHQHPLPTLSLSSISSKAEPKSSCPESLQSAPRCPSHTCRRRQPHHCTLHPAVPPVTVSSWQTEESPSNLALALWMQPNSVSGHPEENLMKASGKQSDRQAVVECWSIWHDDYFSKIPAWG